MGSVAFLPPCGPGTSAKSHYIVVRLKQGTVECRTIPVVSSPFDMLVCSNPEHGIHLHFLTHTTLIEALGSRWSSTSNSHIVSSMHASSPNHGRRWTQDGKKTPCGDSLLRLIGWSVVQLLR